MVGEHGSHREGVHLQQPSMEHDEGLVRSFEECVRFVEAVFTIARQLQKVVLNLLKNEDTSGLVLQGEREDYQRFG